jgi:hypothetical protein
MAPTQILTEHQSELIEDLSILFNKAEIKRIKALIEQHDKEINELKKYSKNKGT